MLHRYRDSIFRLIFITKYQNTYNNKYNRNVKILVHLYASLLYYVYKNQMFVITCLFDMLTSEILRIKMWPLTFDFHKYNIYAITRTSVQKF